MHPFHALIHYICHRPQMYVKQGKFEGAAAFLDGFDSGMRAVYRQLPPEHREGSLLVEFQSWLPQRLGYEQNVVWWWGIMHFYPEDAEAFQKLRELFDEYMAEAHGFQIGETPFEEGLPEKDK